MRACLGCALLALAGLLAVSVSADDKKKSETKEQVIESELINADFRDRVLTDAVCRPFEVKMTAGRTYLIDLRSTAFNAFLRLENAKGEELAADDDSGGNRNARLTFRPTETAAYTLIATSRGEGFGKFSLTIKDITPIPIALKSEKGLATYDGNLTNTDPLYAGNKRHKLFAFDTVEGYTYQIDMKSKAMDSYLFLESPEGMLLAQDDDGGGFPNAKIVFKANKTGAHRIVATYFAPAFGPFTLTVRQLNPPYRPDQK